MNTPPEAHHEEFALRDPHPLPFANLQFIGRGGMANVYRAFDTKLSRYVALKFLINVDEASRRRFVSEARA